MVSRCNSGLKAASVMLALGGTLGTSVAHAAGFECTQAFVGQHYEGGGAVCLTSGALSLYLGSPIDGRLSFEVEQVEDGRIRLLAGKAFNRTIYNESFRPVYGLGAVAVTYVEPDAGVATGTMSLAGTVTRLGRTYIGSVDSNEVYSPTEVTEPLEFKKNVLQVDARPIGNTYNGGLNSFDSGIVPMLSTGFYNQSGSLKLQLNPMVIDVSVLAVPEPSTWALMGLGLVGLTLVRRRPQA